MQILDIETETEVEVLAASLKLKSVLEIITNRLTYKDFRNPTTRWMFRIIEEHFKEFEVVPSKKVIFHRIRSSKEKYQAERKALANKLYSRIKKIASEEDINYFVSQIRKIKLHCEQSILVENLMEPLSRMDTNRFNELLSKYSSNGIYSGNSCIVLPEEHISSFDIRLREKEAEERKEKTIKLGLKDEETDLDEILSKAFSPRYGIFVCVIAATETGKTTFCINFGVRSLLYGFNVFHILFEASAGKKYVKSQYDARITGFPVWSLFDRVLTEKQISIARKKLNKMKGKLFIEKLPADFYTFRNLREIIREIERENGITIDVVICSPIYGLKPATESKAKEGASRVNKLQLYKEGKKFSEEDNCCILLVEDQAKTSEWNNKSYTKASISECPSASSELDFLFGIPQTRGESMRNRARIQLLKKRMGTGRSYEIRVRTRFETCRFIGGW